MIITEPNENYTTGYIKLFRSLSNKSWYNKSEYVHLWIHILIKASYKESEFWFNGKPIILRKGQFITGRDKLSSETGLHSSKIERILNHFEKIEHQIEQQKSNKNRIITVLNWESYQICEQQTEQQLNNKRTTTEQQLNTYNNSNNINKENKVKNIKDIVAPATKRKTLEEQMKELEFELDLYRGEFPEQMLKEFYDYWSEPNLSKTKIRKNTEKTWDTKKRLKRWADNNNKFGKKEEKPDQSNYVYKLPKDYNK